MLIALLVTLLSTFIGNGLPHIGTGINHTIIVAPASATPAPSSAHALAG